jgi:ribosomal protein S18 acetylase RimI-like enzyme
VDAPAIDLIRPRLCQLLIDAVEHGASVGFLSPLTLKEADTFWRRVQHAVADGRRRLLVAALDDGVIAGTVQLELATAANQPHRAMVSKLLVHSSARRQGIGEALMAEVERVAAEMARWLLTLDTATAEARRLYERMGWHLTGPIPSYALNPDGTLTDTWIYWKELAHPG